jgi:DNA-binding GntR family transcriptional regulator
VSTIEVRTVVDLAYDAIRERIMAGTLERGARVHQEDVAAELGISRTPVREALRRLAAEGLVEMHANRGARVADADPATMAATYEARLVIEPGAARLAAERRIDPSIAAMRKALADHRRFAADQRRSFAANREFHLALVGASGNAALLQFAEHLWVGRIGAAVYERQAETPEQVLADADEHAAILDAVAAGDADRAERLTREHIAAALARFSA